MILFEAYQLNARLKHLLLVGQDEDGELDWMPKGEHCSEHCWLQVSKEEAKYE